MKFITIILMLSSLSLFSQKEGYLSISDLVKLQSITNEDVYDFLRPKEFNYVRKDETEKGYVYGYKYDSDTEYSWHWFTKFYDGHIQYQTKKYNGSVIELALENYKTETEFLEDRIRKIYHYKEKEIYIVIHPDEGYTISVWTL